ncbi:MAG: nitroreductase family deazaflavin-dependent oxidoreductase [Chloroflexi bacterium]|nr:nitroreductase family deazaflavin-dependent oxidoreductase [Chloroflexota bacterium]MBV9895517.1 nitroreductase family deazaflavin-dependent oxidoreductase [Chloroflexota bacterium]
MSTRVESALPISSRRVTYRLLEGDERERLWARMVAQWPMATEYQQATTRQIPLLALHHGVN